MEKIPQDARIKIENKAIEQMAEEKYPYNDDSLYPNGEADYKLADQIRVDEMREAYAQCYRDHCLPVVEEIYKAVNEMEDELMMRKKLLESKHIDKGMRERNEGGCIAYEKYLPKLKSALSHVPVEGDDGWISVNDRLPEKTGDYLVWETNHGIKAHGIMRFDSYNKTWYEDGDVFHPSHWRPLPTPPTNSK